jgi:transcription elongation factor GreB
MSKAFTKEDGGSEPVLGRAPPRVAPGEKRYVTPEGYQAMQEELSQLANEQARVAASLSPLEAGERLKDLDQRASTLRATLESLTVVAPEKSQADRVFFGAWVTLEDEEGEVATYRIVGPDEADARSGLLSVDSPLARALLGKAEGDSVAVERPRGVAEFTVTSVRYGTAP